MKAILISDHAKWCALMMNGYKTVEVRKENVGKAVQKLIDEQGFADIYVYCSKGKPNLWLPYEYDCFELDEASQPYLSDKPIVDIDTKMNGKVIFKFRCYKVEEIYYECGNNGISINGYKWFYTEELDLVQDFEKASCLNENELYNYLQPKEAGGTPCGYAIHISDLEIFDKPKEISEFRKPRYCDCKLRCNNNLEHSFCREHCQHNLDSERLSVCCDRDGWVKEWNNGTNCLTKAPQSWCYVEVE